MAVAAALRIQMGPRARWTITHLTADPKSLTALMGVKISSVIWLPKPDSTNLPDYHFDDVSALRTFLRKQCAQGALWLET